ncbi:MAG: DUF3857 domain-containing protein, partial [Acidobacteria bacterium]|nr:DUF3857 domain-containing protein [Acidobacteriota bacterium]
MCCETPYNVQTKLKSFANFLKLLIHLILLSTLVCHQLPIFCKKPIKEEKKIYEWTALPDETILQKAKETKSQNGLVVLERKSEIYIGGFLAWLMGYPSVTKEEFIRFLVVDENGLKNSDAEIEVLAASKVEDVEARTVLPDGKILNIDKDKDIEMLEVQTYKSSKTIFSAGKVKFPSPQIGAILDLHYKISSNSFVLLWLEPLAYKNLPTLKLNLKLIVSDNKIGWQVITLNTTKTNILNSIKPGEVD